MKRYMLLCLAVAAIAGLVPGLARAADPSKTLSGDTDGVLVLNLRQMLDSPLVKKYYLSLLKAALQKDAKVTKSLVDAGIDPLKDIDTIWLSGSATDNGAKALAIVKGRFDVEKINTAAAGLVDKGEGKLKITKEGALRVFEIQGDDKPVYVSFKDNHTAIASLSKDQTVELATGRAARKPDKALAAAISKVNSKDSIWMALVITPDIKKKMAMNPQTAAIAPNLESITASVNMTESLLARILIHTNDEKAAEQVEMLANQLKPFLMVLGQADEKHAPLVNELMNNLKIAAEKKAVSISLKIPEDLLKKLNQKDQDQK